MKTPVNRKGQGTGYAVPLILLGFLGLFLIYIVLVYPSERAKLLNLKEFDSSEIEYSPLGEGSRLLYSSAEVFEVGRTMGQEVFTWRIKDVSVNHAAVPKTISSSGDVVMSASVFKSDTELFKADNINLENTKEIVVSLNVAEVKGNPTIEVILNETIVYQRTAEPGEMNIKIQTSVLGENNPIHIRVKHQGGAFWSAQSVSFSSIEINQYYYEPVNSVSSEKVIISENNYKGNMINIEFNVTESVTDGELRINIKKPGAQKVAVWSGAPDEGVVRAGIDINKMGIGENTIEFEAVKGGEYKISNLKLLFIAEAQPPATKTYSFDLEKGIVYKTGDILIGIKVDRIIEPGNLFFKMGTSETSYYFPNEELASGAWSYALIDKTNLKDLGNKITLDSVNGRFAVSGFVIVAR